MLAFWVRALPIATNLPEKADSIANHRHTALASRADHAVRRLSRRAAGRPLLGEALDGPVFNAAIHRASNSISFGGLDFTGMNPSCLPRTDGKPTHLVPDPLMPEHDPFHDRPRIVHVGDDDAIANPKFSFVSFHALPSDPTQTAMMVVRRFMIRNSNSADAIRQHQVHRHRRGLSRFCFVGPLLPSPARMRRRARRPNRSQSPGTSRFC